jgi:hypothetical protein
VQRRWYVARFAPYTPKYFVRQLRSHTGPVGEGVLNVIDDAARPEAAAVVSWA